MFKHTIKHHAAYDGAKQREAYASKIDLPNLPDTIEERVKLKARAYVYVSGRVQGVFFRAETADLARSLGLGGWVRNLPDGRVEALFEGEKEVVEKALDFCRRGPPGAQVSNLDVKWENWTGEFHDFRIIH